MIEWTYDGEQVNEIPDGAIGFTYCLYFDDNTMYIGKKLAKTTKRLKTLKNGKKRKGHIRFTYKRKGGKNVPYEEIEADTDWRKYEGSFDRERFESSIVLSKEILQFFSSKKAMSYAEEFELFTREVLLKQYVYRNSNIGGRYYPGNVEEGKEWTIQKKE